MIEINDLTLSSWTNMFILVFTNNDKVNSVGNYVLIDDVSTQSLTIENE